MLNKHVILMQQNNRFEPRLEPDVNAVTSNERSCLGKALAHIVTSVSTCSAKPDQALQSVASDQVVPCLNRFYFNILNIIETNCSSANVFEMDASTSSAKPDQALQGAASHQIVHCFNKFGVVKIRGFSW